MVNSPFSNQASYFLEKGHLEDDFQRLQAGKETSRSFHTPPGIEADLPDKLGTSQVRQRKSLSIAVHVIM